MHHAYPTPALRVFFQCLILVGLTVLAACTNITRETVPPKVSLHSIRILELGVLEQRFELGVRLQNPNEHSINIRGLDFSLEVNGQPFASGLSIEGVRLPEFGESVLSITATSTLGTLLGQLQELARSQKLDYRLSGKLRLDRLIAPLPFDFSGKVPLQLPTSKAPQPESI